MKFIKTPCNTTESGYCFISSCGKYKAINYGGKIRLYKRYEHTPGKPFGRSVEHVNTNKCYLNYPKGFLIVPERVSKTYSSYRQAFKVAEKAEQGELHG